MARGKHASAAANRRAQLAEERVAELEAARKAEAESNRQREHELRTELDRVRGQLVRAVDEAARERVAQVKDDSARKVADLRAEHIARLESAFRYLSDHGELLFHESDVKGRGGHMEFADRLGITIGQLFTWTVPNANNATRRQTRRLANRNLDIREGAAAQGIGRVD